MTYTHDLCHCEERCEDAISRVRLGNTPLPFPNFSFFRIVDRAFAGIERPHRHQAGDRVLIARVDRGVGRLAGPQALEPVEEVVRHRHVLHRDLAANLARPLGAALGAQDGLRPLDHVEHALVAEDLEAVAAAVAAVGRVAHHESFRIDPHGLHVVGTGEVVLVLVGERAAEADAAGGELGARDVVDEVEEVTAVAADGAVGELAVAVPAGILHGIERLRAAGRPGTPSSPRPPV